MGETFVVTHKGRKIAKIVPVDCVIDGEGNITGERPVTMSVRIQ